MTDREIVEEYRNGSQEKAFNALVKAYSERIYWHVRRFVCSHEDADDLVQEVFVKVWKYLPGFRGESELFTWIYKIATNEALNFLHKQKIRAALQFESLTTELERKIDDDPYFNGDNALRLLNKAIASLPEKQKTVFLLRYYDEIPYEQISEITGTSVGALKASYHFAYEKVRGFLEKNKD
ncbi:MAG: RNA polymerase sigma factor [Bacteroidales bacterium]|nr:RNA polymerase sigma factor [Bacteroidales bacterium]